MTTKKPPAFKHHPPTRAKALKKAWVEKAKIKSKWKAEKRKLGLTPKTEHLGADGDDSNEPEPQHSGPETSTSRSPKVHDDIEPIQKPQKESSDLREMARQAYSRSSLHRYKSDPLHQRQDYNKQNGKKGKGGQPNMKLRMGVMLEKIKRDYQS